MPKMTTKYGRALDTVHHHNNNLALPDNEKIKVKLDNQEMLYTDLQKKGYYWDSSIKQWEYHEPAEANEPTPLIMLRVWADGEVIEEAANDLINLIKRSKLPWELIEQSDIYGCRPPKQREGRIYLKFLPRRT